MNENHDKAWKDLAKRARAGERHVVGGKDAERLLRALPDEGMSETEVDAIVRGVVAGRAMREKHKAEDVNEPQPTSTAGVEEDVLQLNRNKGGEDADAESLLDELRREALEDDKEEDDERVTTTKRKPSHWSRKLRLLGACNEAVAWAKTQSSYADAWRECKRSDWMMWLCDVTTTRSPTELLIEFCTYALEKARPVAGKEAYWAQVEGAHAQVCEALRGNGDIDAAGSAANAAWSAANAAGNVADAARSDLADIIRKHMPKPPKLPAKRGAS